MTTKTFSLAVLLLLALKGTAQVSQNAGLIHHYPINETPSFIDVKGSYHGITNGTLVNVPDRFNNPLGAVEFDSATYVEIPYVIYPSTRSSFTITGWIKPYNNVGEILNDRTLTNSFSYKYRVINYYPGPAPVEFNSYISCHYEGVGCAYSTSGMVPPVMQWYFFAATFDQKSGYHKYYLNGTIVDSTLAPTVYSPYNNNTILGTIKGPTNENPFKGAMDDIRFYDRSLSKLEIDTLYYGYTPPVSVAALTNSFSDVSVYFDRNNHQLILGNIPHADIQLSFYDVSGRCISRNNNASFDNEFIYLHLPDVTEGIYYCNLIDKKTGTSCTRKFVVTQ